jgi:hypothetical protein
VRVTLVTHDSAASRYLAARLHALGAVDRVVIERRTAGARFYWRKLRRVGPANAVFQLLLDRSMRRASARHLDALPMPPHETAPTIAACEFAADELVLAFGTSIVSAATLARAPLGILNLHTGWLPDYRGVKSEFWVMARGDSTKYGWTLHYMTPRLDEGDMVLRRRVDARVESPGHLRALLIADAAPAIAELIATMRRDGPASIPRMPQGDGRYFTTPTLRDWLTSRRASARTQSPER